MICIDCSGVIDLPDDALEGEIIGCNDCGLDYVVEKNNGKIFLKELLIEGEDWGE
jgi:alpha-aminoadipate carrier protein LysW